MAITVQIEGSVDDVLFGISDLFLSGIQLIVQVIQLASGFSQFFGASFHVCFEGGLGGFFIIGVLDNSFSQRLSHLFHKVYDVLDGRAVGEFTVGQLD